MDNETVIVAIHAAWGEICDEGGNTRVRLTRLSFQPIPARIEDRFLNGDQSQVWASDAIYRIRVPRASVTLMNPGEDQPIYGKHTHSPALMIAKANRKVDGHEWVEGESIYRSRCQIEAFYRTGNNVEPCE